MPRSKNHKLIIPKRRSKRILKDNGEWRLVTKHKTPFLAMPPELHVKILDMLNPIDAVCFTLVNKYIFALLGTFVRYIPLNIGAPDSERPVIRASGCRHCLPVLLYPAHCELQFHLTSFIPPDYKYCAGCAKFTKCEDKGFSDSEKYCGVCGVNYWRRFQRGRRMIDMERPGEKQKRLRKWYNVDVRA